MTRTDQTIRRPKSALRDTLSYLTTARHHRPTTVKQAARDLRISRSVAASRLAKLSRSAADKVERLGRGKYRAVTSAAVATVPAKRARNTRLPSDADSIEKRLAALRGEQVAIEQKIQTLSAALELLR